MSEEPQATLTDEARSGWVRREWAITLELLVAAVGLVVIGDRRFRPGCIILGAALLLGALLRATLPERSVGLLRLRSRLIDVVTMLVLGSLTIALALAVPQPR
jgi:Protein of unknown function (DUF3017)